MDRAIEKETNILQVLLNKVNTFNYYTDNTQSQILKTVEAVERTNECFSIEGANWLYHKAKQQGIKCRCFLGVLEHNGCIYDEHAFLVFNETILLEFDYKDWLGIHQYDSFQTLIENTICKMYGCSLFGRNICVLKGIWEYVPQNRNISVSEFYAEIFEKTPLYTEDNFIDIKLRVIDIVDDHDPRSKRKSGILSKRHEIWTCGEPYISSGKYKSRIYLRSYVGGIKRFGDGKRYLTDSQHPAYLRVYSKRCEFIGFLNITGPKPKNNNEIVECFKGTTSNLERYYEDIILWANGERTVEVWNKQEKKHIPTIISEWDHCKNVSKELQKNYNEMKIRIQKAYLKRYEEFNQQSELYIRIRHKYGRLKYRRDN